MLKQLLQSVFFSSLLCSLSLLLYSFCFYNENRSYNTYEGAFFIFPSYNSKLSYRIKDYIYFTFILINAYNQQMRATLKICITIPKTFKSKYILPAITLMFHLLNSKRLQNVRCCISSCPPLALARDDIAS
jgi:hypothetical protein